MVYSLLQALASSSVPQGALPVGPTLAARFDEGQSFDTLVELRPGRCYTLIGFGMPPIENIDLAIVADPAGPSPEIVARDDTSAPTAVLGQKPDCLKWPTRRGVTAAKLVMTVTRGTGIAAAQLYQK
jgi:hypothetical protein